MNSTRWVISSLPIMSFIILALMEFGSGQSITTAPSPSPIAPPSNDSTTIDQGIAYGLLLVALAITYLVH
ncbi:hypothetical protein ACH5RR_004223 [Cinchona calisaya]|uniref:Arabinogalactan peptide 22 n=1 Tax=Cinchona calisaya TaxID=153742 RepID=A0ABD3AWY6_9GENT